MKPCCRATAARCLSAVFQGSSLKQQLPLLEQALPENERALYRQLCYGVLRSFERLQAVAAQLLNKPLKDKDCDIHMLLLLGLYQLAESHIPAHAAVSQTVAATTSLRKPWAKALVNGVLRQWQRRHESLLAELDSAAQLAHPRWLYQALRQAWPDQAEAIMQANNQHPPLTLRCNRRQQDRASYLARLEQADIAAKACRYGRDAIQLLQPRPVEQLPGFADGAISVQDEAAQLCVELLALAPGQRVLDACCAPGGKTCHILECEPALAELVAVDVDAARLQRVGDNLARLQLRATLLCADAQSLAAQWQGQPFDRILLDAPCSATGVIRRNPDIKLHRRASDIDALAQLQRQLLAQLWPLLKPGGLLLYATCSVLPQENEQTISAFCAQQTDAQSLPIAADWGLARPQGRQLFPQIDGHDGFYYALLRKSAPGS